ncbi:MULTISPECIES: DRTGG domain-containing protein [unclassified Gemella]|uniref:DRTGG domain-containing protein n=1 Tax=unclassified Gemella TaxID=2624949 RepID=UPI001C05BBF5|nr:MULTISPECIES: DRTGG domain-containing protein [unclassified Gemella]MBU0278262.1 CBS domain-containing protein [Gemella sp. zg-1178]QWQ38230.1 CBS domain-containing protein [Gemella sp. zg-570]
MKSKHQKILEYIKSLPIGSKISVRKVAKDLRVSEGTAYRAIKESENRGFVSSIERVGTVRIQKKERDNIEKLSYSEIVNIVGGQLIAGRGGVHEIVQDFAIGAMDAEQIGQHIRKGTLLIVGNRPNIISMALSKDCAILVAGGYMPSEEIKKVADIKNLPLIVTPHDSFSVAHLINRVTNDQIIKRDIVTVESIYIPRENIYTIDISATVKDWYELQLRVGHTRFPVVNEYGKLVGIVTARDVFLQKKEASMRDVMERDVMTTKLDAPVSSVGNTMLSEGFELMPVTDDKNTLLGIVTRKIVINSMLANNRYQESQNSDTFDEIIRKGIVPRAEGLQIKVIPQMLDQFGTFSRSALLSIIDESIHIVSHNYNKSEVLMQNVNVYFLKTVPLDRIITTKVMIMDIGRKSARFDVEVYDKNDLVTKALVTCQVFRRN